MIPERRKQIESRGEILARLCKQILEQDPADPIASAGFRWGLLLVETPRRYFESFKHCDLRISEFELEQAIHDFDAYLPGESYLCWDERQILENHNTESEKWMSANQHPVIELGREASGIYA